MVVVVSLYRGGYQFRDYIAELADGECWLCDEYFTQPFYHCNPEWVAMHRSEWERVNTGAETRLLRMLNEEVTP